MGKVLLEGGIIVLLVLIGISVFIPDGSNNVSNVIIDFENSVENGEEIGDGEIENVEISKGYSSNFVSKLNCKIANMIVNGLNSIFDIGMKVLRIIIN